MKIEFHNFNIISIFNLLSDPSEPEITNIESTATTISVRWQPGSGTVTEYAVTYRRSGSGSPGVSDPIIVSAHAGGGSPMATITGLAPGQMYIVYVKAVVNYNSDAGADVPGERRESSEASITATTCKYRCTSSA